MFDRLGATLGDYLGSHENNNVGYIGKKVFGFDEGGAVDTTDNTPDTPTWLKAINSVAGAAKQTIDKGYGYGATGSFYNSPAYIASHYTALGKFFNSAEPGNKYTDRYISPTKVDNPQIEDPETFYARWYNRMRNFAQAEEIAGHGQPTVRSR